MKPTGRVKKRMNFLNYTAVIGSGGKNFVKTAAYTITQNEPIFLPAWLKYYSRYFDDIHIFNHNTTDGSVEKAHKSFKFTEHKIDNTSSYNPQFMLNMGKDAQRLLLKDYDVVLFAETDEFILADPDKYTGLDDFIKQMKDDYVYATGREVFQLDEEKKLDWEKPLLTQRSAWWPHIAYYKPTISKVPLDWAKGFHYIKKEINNTSGLGLGEYIKSIATPDIYMVHLQKIDWDTFCSRGRFKKDKAHFHIGINEKELIPDKWKKVL